MDEKLVEKSMQIIISSGEARDFCMKALEQAEEGNYEKAAELHAEAKKAIVAAHHIQTECIQGATAGEPFEYNVLFAHAQDTMMTVFSEINLTGHIIKLCRNLSEKQQ